MARLIRLSSSPPFGPISVSHSRPSGAKARPSRLRWPERVVAARRSRRPSAVRWRTLPRSTVRVLRRRELQPFAAGDEHRPVGGEGDTLRIMGAAADLRLLPPDHLVALEPRWPWPEDQPAIAQRGAAGAVRPGFGEAQIDALVAGKIGVSDDLGKTALPFDMDRRNAGDLLLAPFATSISHSLPGLLGDQRRIGQRQRPIPAGTPSPTAR